MSETNNRPEAGPESDTNQAAAAHREGVAAREADRDPGGRPGRTGPLRGRDHHRARHRAHPRPRRAARGRLRAPRPPRPGATGLRDKLPDIPGIRERWGRDLLHCPHCHGYEARDQPLGALGTWLVIEDDRLRGVELAEGRVVPRTAVYVVPRDALLTELGCARNEDGWVSTDPSGAVTGRQALAVAGC
ncbi:hypothetical protein ACFVFQ_31190 [Streptomyces sp. NPDC057743]|uniref:hypothetical protein n=1 Tax=Streptomyces sp. NPDC057743 TaxID=3346236 RepID=UPI0036A068D9